MPEVVAADDVDPNNPEGMEKFFMHHGQVNAIINHHREDGQHRGGTATTLDVGEAVRRQRQHATTSLPPMVP